MPPRPHRPHLHSLHLLAALLSDRRWRYRFCQLEVSCGDPGYPDNSQRTGSRFLYGDLVAYTCDNGYFQSSGPANGTRVCQETGLWSDTPPICTGGQSQQMGTSRCVLYICRILSKGLPCHIIGPSLWLCSLESQPDTCICSTGEGVRIVNRA